MITVTEISLDVPDKAKEEFDSEGIDLRTFVKEAIESKVFELELKKSSKMRRLFVESISSKSKLTEEEADKFAVELGRKMKKGRSDELQGSEGV